jgi:hypothetical protein
MDEYCMNCRNQLEGVIRISERQCVPMRNDDNEENRDVMVILAIVGCIVAIGVFVATNLVLTRRAKSIACPECGELMAQDELTAAGVTCPHCGWHLESSESIQGDYERTSMQAQR